MSTSSTASRRNPLAKKGGKSRAALFLDVSRGSLWGLVISTVIGRPRFTLPKSQPDILSERLTRLFGVEDADLESCAELIVGPESTQEPMRRAIARLESRRIDDLVRAGAREFPNVPEAADILRSGLLKVVADRSLDAFFAETWSRASGYSRVHFYGASPWDSLTLRSASRPGLALQAAAWIAGVFKTLRRSRFRGDPKPPAQEVPRSSSADGLKGQAPEADQRPSEPTVLYVVNHGTVYGNLYAYDHLLSQDPNSPLHRRNVVFMGRSGGRHNAEGIALGFPSSGSRRTQLARALLVTTRTLWFVRSVRAWREAWELGRITARARGQSLNLAINAPSVRLAVFAYDLQVPIELTLALEDRGIATVAMNERPNSVAISSQPFAVGTLLTASEWFSDLAESNRSVSAANSCAVGMWRTDFIHRYRSEPLHDLMRNAKDAGQKLVVVLPYHLDTANPNPLGTSDGSVRHFIEGMLDLAEQHPDLHFVFRSKNDGWLSDPRLQATGERMTAQSNCAVSREYGKLNESYRLVASADLVIAKYTSLVDESLAVGIPCLIHDYLPIARGIARPLAPYLPPELFIEDECEWPERLDWALAENGTTFNTWWEPLRHGIFGEWCDGRVRERARGVIERIYASCNTGFGPG